MEDNYSNYKILDLNPFSSHATSSTPNLYSSLLHGGIFSKNEDKFRVILSAPKQSWSVVRIEEDRISANFQGNPLWVPYILRNYPNITQWFGISTSNLSYKKTKDKNFVNVSADSLVLPFTETLNKKMKELFGLDPNKKLFLFQDINDYESFYKRNKMPSSEEYVNIFIDHSLLPMGRIHTRDSAHDWSYHFISLLFPDILENLRSNLLYIREHLNQFQGMTQYAWNHYGNTLNDYGEIQGVEKVQRLTYRDCIYRQMAIGLDVASAKLVKILVRLQGKKNYRL